MSQVICRTTMSRTAIRDYLVTQNFEDFDFSDFTLLELITIISLNYRAFISKPRHNSIIISLCKNYFIYSEIIVKLFFLYFLNSNYGAMKLDYYFKEAVLVCFFVIELKKVKILLAEFKLKSGLTVSLTKSKFMPFVAWLPSESFPLRS